MTEPFVPTELGQSRVVSALPSYDDEWRQLAHETVDRIFDHVRDVASAPVVEWTEEAHLRDLVRIGSEEGEKSVSFAELVSLLTRYAVQLHHPMYAGHQVSPPIPPAVIADFVVSALNQSTAVWEMSPLGTVIEKEIVHWMMSQVGYPEDAAGTAVSGGSTANLTALLAARARWNEDAANEGRSPVILCSADAHYSVARAASILGLPSSSLILIGTDGEHRLDLNVLSDALESLEGSEQSPMAIVATSGSTATGSFDRLEEIANLRDRHRTWMHVDAAHGASVVLSEKLRHLVAGIERSDSLAWDPHKMMWMPISSSYVLVRHQIWLRRAFSTDAPYLFQRERLGRNIGEVTIQCSRRADAIKLWVCLKTVGVGAFATAMENMAETTRYLHARLLASSDFEPSHLPDFNILCFRFIGQTLTGSPDEFNERVREAVIRQGRTWITSTVLKGSHSLRVTIINPATGAGEIDAMLEAIRDTARQIVGG